MKFRVLLCLPMILLFTADPAGAHKVSVFAWVEGDLIHTESKFSRGKMVKQGLIVVYDLQGNRLLEGETDEQGNFSFDAPKKAALKIELQAGMGHRAEWVIRAEEMGVESPPGTAGIGERGEDGTHTPERVMEEVSVVAPTAEDIQRAVERALDKKLGPVLKRLAESRERTPNLTDILGGIGYILGLLGIASYVYYRKRK